jgi:hypothetical protein
MDCFTEFPAMGSPVDIQAEPVGQYPGLQQKPFQVVRPKLPVGADISGRDEYGRRHVISLQQWFGVVQVIGIAIVKRDDDRTTPEMPISKSLT